MTWAGQDSNLRPSDYESPALTTVLPAQKKTALCLSVFFPIVSEICLQTIKVGSGLYFCRPPVALTYNALITSILTFWYSSDELPIHAFSIANFDATRQKTVYPDLCISPQKELMDVLAFL